MFIFTTSPARTENVAVFTRELHRERDIQLQKRSVCTVSWRSTWFFNGHGANTRRKRCRSSRTWPGSTSRTLGWRTALHMTTFFACRRLAAAASTLTTAMLICARSCHHLVFQTPMRPQCPSKTTAPWVGTTLKQIYSYHTNSLLLSTRTTPKPGKLAYALPRRKCRSSGQKWKTIRCLWVTPCGLGTGSEHFASQ